MALALAACTFFPAGAAEQPVKKPFTIPEIMQWKSASGSFVLADNFRIVVPKKASSDLQNVAELLADDYAMFHGYRPQIVTGKSQPGDVVLKLGKNKQKTIPSRLAKPSSCRLMLVRGCIMPHVRSCS